MASISGNGNYVSDADIMVWLAQEQDRIYGDLRESMDLARDRASFADALNGVKAALHQANGAEPSNFQEAHAKMQEILENYGSDPDYAELCKDLEKIAGPLAARVAEEDGHAAALQKYEQAQKAVQAIKATQESPDYKGPKLSISQLEQDAEKLRPTPLMNHPFSDNDLKTFDDIIGGKLELVNRNDQLAMIHIQQLKSLGDQSTQLGSQFIASTDKTMGSIINNIA